MGSPYYTSDPINLSFRVRAKGMEPLKITSATVSLYGPDGEIFVDAPTEINEDLIEYTVPGSALDSKGDYTAEFKVNIQPDIVRTHTIEFRVLGREPIFSDTEDKRLMPIDETADDMEIGGAISMAIRMLRRAGTAITEAAKISTDLAQKMTNKRLK